MNYDDPVFCSLAMIEERIQEKLTIENLAEELYLSKYHYQRLFRETVGDSVMRYVARRRMRLAAQELAQHREVTILEIALKYGYDTHEGFTRSFRAHMGVTPAEYRKYHGTVFAPAMPKERCVMLYSKMTDEMLRELNALIVQAKETADYWNCLEARCHFVTLHADQSNRRDFFCGKYSGVRDRTDNCKGDATAPHHFSANL